MKKTSAYIKETLEKMGYTPQKCGNSGLVATVGQGEKCCLLRADADALPIREQTGLSYACKYGNMHACGHDFHTAMLLGAAKLLKERESALCGRVKLLFQPAEELLEGAKNCVKNGVLERIGAAFSLHVAAATDLPTGTVLVPPAGVGAPAADFFKIEIKGKGCHGSAPWNGIDSLTVASFVLLALQSLPAREFSPNEDFVLTVGGIEGSTAGNAIPNTVSLKGTLRSFDEDVQSRVKARMEALARGIAKAFRASAKIVYEGGCPSLFNDEPLCGFAFQEGKALLGENAVLRAEALQGAEKRSFGGSEDFAYIAKEVPSVMLALSAGERKKGYEYPLHHPKVRFDEAALPIGGALFARLAFAWLKK